MGGGRNLDFDENTTEFAQTEIVQNKLEELLKEVFTQSKFEIIVGVESWVSVARTYRFPIV
jgi:hypothetical protein